MVQSVLIEDLVNGCVTDYYSDLSSCMILKIAFNLAWTPTPFSAQFENQLNCRLRSFPVGVRSLGFDSQSLPPIFPIEAPLSIDCSLIDSKSRSYVTCSPIIQLPANDPSPSLQNPINHHTPTRPSNSKFELFLSLTHVGG